MTDKKFDKWVDKEVGKLFDDIVKNPKRIVVVNDEIYLLSEKRFNQIFKVGIPIPKIIKLMDKTYCAKEHEKLCNKVRKHGRLLDRADRILRDD